MSDTDTTVVAMAEHLLHLDLVGGLFPARTAGVVLAAVLVPDAAVHMGARCTLRLPCKQVEQTEQGSTDR